MDNNTIINVGDTIKDLGEITRMSNTYVWFGEKKYSIKTIQKRLDGIVYKYSPDTEIDWKDAIQVDNYYNSFIEWAGKVRMGDSKKSQILEVKNNKIFFEGEYYLPAYNDRTKIFMEDGFIFGFCVKLKNSFWSHLTEKTVNVFYFDHQLSTEDIKNQETKTENKNKLSDVEYLKSLNPKKINGSDLDLLKNNFHLLFDKSIFPYTTNGVTFSISTEYSWRKVIVSHRNRTGIIKIDNGYWGASPFGNDYYAIVKVSSDFTNECSYNNVRAEGSQITFNKAMLDALASQVVNVWDKAIEANAKNWG